MVETKNMRIALIHDYLSQDGGAERVLLAFHEIWPEAPIFVLFHDKKKITYINPKNIRESFLAALPFIKTHYPWYLPLMPLAVERYSLRDFDVALSSTSAFSKGVIVSPSTLHISYCHTPPRYIWADAEDYLSELKYNPLVKAFLPGLLHRLRLWDKMSADRVDHFIANSQTVRRRINKYYRRESDVIYPPVNMGKSLPPGNVGDYFAAGGRLVPYKKMDIAIRTFNRLRWPLKIFGVGPEMPKLQAMAKDNIQFLGHINDEEKNELLAGCRAFIHPQIEDLGITPLEAMAAGRPVIAFAEGGATETVVPYETGLFFPEQTWESLLDTLLKFNHEHWDYEKIRARAEDFDSVRFKEKIKRYVEDRYEESKNGFEQGVLIR